MKISKKELIEMNACQSGLKRFIRQTNNTDDQVDVKTLIGGKNTYSDLLWLAGKKLSKELIIKFAKKVALINIEHIKDYCSDENYKLILDFLNDDAAVDAAYAAVDAVDAAVDAAYAAVDAAVDAAYAAVDAARAAAYAAVDAVDAVVDAARAAVDAAARAAAYAAVYAAARAADAAVDAKIVNLFIDLFSN